MNFFRSASFHATGPFVALFLSLQLPAMAQKLEPGKITEIAFSDAELPPTLHALRTGEKVASILTVRLPDDYDSTRSFPLLVYVPGFDGGLKGNIYNAQTIAGSRGWIVATLPLFKKNIDKGEPADGIPVSFEDYPVVSRSYAIMLGRLFDLVPNVDRNRSAMVGFSNGALTIAVLVSCHDGFILDHFRNFCMVDHGMFHLMDLHKKASRDCRFLVLVGDKEGPGRELKIRQSRLLQDEMKLLGVNLTSQILKDTGHEFQERHMALVGKWLRNEPLEE